MINQGYFFKKNKNLYMNFNLQKLYEDHHSQGKRQGFSIFEKERGAFFKQQIGVGKNVLDLGCRDGTLTKYYAQGNKVLGVDIDKNLLDIAQKKLKIDVKHFDVYDDWKFESKFDVVVAGEILEHLYYPENILKKISQVLNPRGTLLLSVPNGYIFSSRIRFLIGQGFPALDDPTHINVFSQRSLKTILSKYFTDIEITGIAPSIYKPFHFLSNSFFAADLLVKATRK